MPNAHEARRIIGEARPLEEARSSLSAPLRMRLMAPSGQLAIRWLSNAVAAIGSWADFVRLTCELLSALSNLRPCNNHLDLGQVPAGCLYVLSSGWRACQAAQLGSGRPL
eukprot:10699240-Alexandrium_andersonii.AAC.1